MSGIWFLDDVARLKREREAVRALEDSSSWLSGCRWHLERSGLALDAIIFLHGREYFARMTYPEHFPAVPPVVRPKDRSERWSSHQYGDGTLCLEWGPDTWDPAVTGAQMLESLYRLLSLEAPEGPRGGLPAPSRHRLTQGQELRSERGRFLLGRALATRLLHLEEGKAALAEFTLHFRGDSFLVVIHAIRTADAAEWQDPELPRPFRVEPTPKYEATVMRLRCAAQNLTAIETLQQLNGILSENGCEPISTEGKKSVIVLDEAGGPHFFLRLTEGSDAVYRLATVRWEKGEGAERPPPGYDALLQKSVGIVGLGSLGSKIAISLARTGVGRFHLVDDDLFFPENAVRHALDLAATAEHKVDGVSQLIARVSEHAEVTLARVNLTGQESNAVLTRELKKLAQCDLIIDATADPQVFNLLAAASTSEDVPLVWGEVFAGGIGGLVARSRPERDPRPHIVRRGLAAYTQDHPAPELFPAGNYAARADDGAILVATDADVSVIAALITELALDCVLAPEPSRFPQSLYLVGLARCWVFEAPLHVIPIETSGLPGGVEEQVELGPAELREEMVFLRSLIGEAKDESANPG